MSYSSLFRDLERSVIGYDQFFNRIEEQARRAYSSFPPYSIRKDGDHKYVIELAVAGFGNVHQATGTGGALKFEDIVDAASLLDAKNVPTTERALVVNGIGLADLRKVEQFTLYKNTGERGLVEQERGIVGEIYTMPVYLSEAIKPVSGKLNFLMFHREAIVGATQNVPKMETGREKLVGVDYIVGSQLWGVKVLRPDHGVVIKRTAP